MPNDIDLVEEPIKKSTNGEKSQKLLNTNNIINENDENILLLSSEQEDDVIVDDKHDNDSATTKKEKKNGRNDNKKSQIQLNILTRPKRAIHFKKLFIPPELVKKISGSDHVTTSSSDEDFVPDTKKKSKHIISKSNSNITSEEDDDDDDETDEDDEEEVSTTDSSSTSSDKDEEEKDTIENKNEVDLDDDKSSKSSNDSDEKQAENESKPKKNNRNKNNTGKQKKKKVKKKSLLRNFDSDEETKRFLSNFKSPTIKKQLNNEKKKPKKSSPALITPPNARGGRKRKVQLQDQEVQTTIQKPNSGPHIKCVQQQPYSMYTICQFPSKATTSGESTTSTRLPKDKAPAVTDTQSEWLCALCSNGNYLRTNNRQFTIGNLFGPYRISVDYEYDLNDKDDENNFKEMWLHESCAVWTPNIFIRNNSLIGIAQAIKLAINKTCSQCKLPGASLICKKSDCKKAYHYPCAVLQECNFDDQDFTISCKKCNNNNNNNNKSSNSVITKVPPKLERVKKQKL